MSYTTRGGTFYPKFHCEGTVHGGEMKLIRLIQEGFFARFFSLAR
jgi:hypothetical protein